MAAFLHLNMMLFESTGADSEKQCCVQRISRRAFTSIPILFSLSFYLYCTLSPPSGVAHSLTHGSSIVSLMTAVPDPSLNYCWLYPKQPAVGKHSFYYACTKQGSWEASRRQTMLRSHTCCEKPTDYNSFSSEDSDMNHTNWCSIFDVWLTSYKNNWADFNFFQCSNDAGWQSLNKQAYRITRRPRY